VPPARDAYTLTEMLVVLAIIGIMAAIVVPQISYSQKGVGLKGAATDLMSTLRTARRMAIAEREYRIVALNLFAIPGEFVIMRPKNYSDTGPQLWIPVGETHRLSENIAIVSVSPPTWNQLDVLRTDDADLDGVEDAVLKKVTNTAVYNFVPAIFNPELDPTTGDPNPSTNLIVNSLFRVIRFYPTGTADAAMIYLWNTTEGRREIPNPTADLSAANLANLGVPPGLTVDASGNQLTYFDVTSPASEDDIYYYTLVVNRLTGSVEVYDYAWGYGSPQWNRKKDGSR